MKDPYVEKAKLQNYRCRSAFKLLQMNEKFQFLRPGITVVDCGASPGSWAQVAVRCCNADGKDVDLEAGTVVGIDLIKIHPIAGAIFLSPADFTKISTQNKLMEILGGKLVDVFMSDMAPNASGISELDHEAIINLVVEALRFSLQVSKPGADFLAKIWDGNQRKSLMHELERFFRSVSIVKPEACRKESSELYLFCRGFKGIQK